MLSVFCSNTLIFAPECWKCTLRYPDFKIFPGGMPPDFPSNLRFRHLQVTPWVLSGTILSFLYRQLQSFCHLLKTLLKTLFHTFNHYLLIAWYYIHRARSKSETLRLNVFITFFWKLKFNVKEKLLIKPETKWNTEISGPPCAFLIQVFRERLSEKVHPTTPKGIVGSFECPVLQRNLKELHGRPRTYVCECQRKVKKLVSTATVVRNSVLIISHITLRDCRVHIFSDNLSRNSCMHCDFSG